MRRSGHDEGVSTHALTPLRGSVTPTVPGYVLEDLVGHGASGTVWAAHTVHPGPDGEPRRYAVKLTRAARPPKEALRRVSSEHLVRVHEVVPLQDGGVAVVLDLAEGGSVRELVGSRGGLPPCEAVTILTPVATALSELHAVGLVHGDLAPGNVLLTDRGKPLVGDLESVHALTDLDWQVEATPGFTAPEVVRGEQPTPPSDLWSLGALGWFVLTGTRVPDDLPLLPTAQRTAAAASAVGAELGGILAALLDQEPTARPTAAAAAAAIYDAVTPGPVTLVERQLDPASALTRRIRREAVETRTRAELRAGELGGRERRRRVVQIGVTALSALGIAAVLVHAGLADRGSAPAEAIGAVGPAAVASTSTGAAAPTATPAPTADPVVALQASPAQLLQTLLDTRAQALVAADPRALAAVTVSGSPIWTTDSGTVAALVSGQQRYVDLSYRVQSAQVVSAGPDSAQVTAVVDRAAYGVVGPGAATETRAPAPQHTATYTLSLVQGAGWKLAAVTAPD